MKFGLAFAGGNIYIKNVLAFVVMAMERNSTVLRALFAGVEPIIIGLVSGRQWLVLLGLCNIFVILLRHNTTSTKTQKHNTISDHVFSYKSHLQKLSTQNNYFGAISFIAVIAGLVAYVLGVGDQYSKVALGLMTSGIAYWIIAAPTHGISNTWKSSISKVFGALVVLGAGWAFLGSSSGQAFFMNLPTTLKEFVSIPKAAAPVLDNGNPTIPTGTTSTDTPVQSATPEQPAETTTTTSETPAATDNTTALTFREVVPALVKAYNLPVPNGTIGFTNIASTSPLYNDFKAGYAARFFGSNINPLATVSCNVYLVMIGLAQKWDVAYNSSTVFSAYRAEAEKRGLTFGCNAGASVTQANLPQ